MSGLFRKADKWFGHIKMNENSVTKAKQICEWMENKGENCEWVISEGLFGVFNMRGLRKLKGKRQLLRHLQMWWKPEWFSRQEIQRGRGDSNGANASLIFLFSCLSILYLELFLFLCSVYTDASSPKGSVCLQRERCLSWDTRKNGLQYAKVTSKVFNFMPWGIHQIPAGCRCFSFSFIKRQLSVNQAFLCLGSIPEIDVCWPRCVPSSNCKY